MTWPEVGCEMSERVDGTPVSVHPMPEDLRPPVLRRLQFIEIVVVSALVAVGSTLVSGAVGLGLIQNWLLLSMVGVGFFLVFGLGGQFAFSQAAFYGIGAYTSAWATRGHIGADGHTLVGGHPFIVGFLAAVVVSVIVALVFSVIVQRANQFYFAIATLALSYLALDLIQKTKGFANGGDVSRVKEASLMGYAFATPHRQVVLLIGGLAVALLAVALIERSPMRRELIALRDNPIATSTTGVPVRKLRFEVFVVGSTIAAAAGSLYAHTNGSLSLETFGLGLGIDIFLIVLFGGIGTMWGALLGAAFVVWVPERLKFVGNHQDLVYGIALVVVMVLFPQGLEGIVRSLVGRAKGLRRSADAPDG